MKLKHWTIISDKEAEIIVDGLNPIDIIDLEKREQAHVLRRRLIEELGKMQSREIIWEAKKKNGGLKKMTDEQSKLVGVFSNIVEARKKLMDAQNIIVQCLSVLEMIEEAEDEPTSV